MIDLMQVEDSAYKAMEPLQNYVASTAPELLSTGLLGKYFTKVQQGASVNDIAQSMIMDGGMAPENASELSKLMHLTAQNLYDLTGVASNYGAQSEASNRVLGIIQNAYNSTIGSPTFGTLTDEWALAKARKGLEDSGQDTQQGYQFLTTLSEQRDPNAAQTYSELLALHADPMGTFTTTPNNSPSTFIATGMGGTTIKNHDELTARLRKLG